ncbi:hypothetical protein CRYUN_Cryun12cG0023000 [Craigia yunnanensis]
MQQKRVSLLMTSAVFEGASVGPLIGLAVQIDPWRREYLYLGGLFSSVDEQGIIKRHNWETLTMKSMPLPFSPILLLYLSAL